MKLLISMMYHHVLSDRCSNDLAIFDKHLEYISQNCTTLFPTLKKIPKNAICLVFDDGYYDFYKYIFPLLQKYNLKALLAVVPQYVLDDCVTEDVKRLSPEHNELFAEYKDGTFCTYKELEEMQKSGLVQIASHSYSHINLLEDGVDLDKELRFSQEILEEKLHTKIESFVFPFGKYNQTILDETLKSYKYAFRIGNAVNKNFHGVNGVIYRIDGDFLTHPSDIFSFKNMLRFHFKTLVKSIVGNK